MADPTGPVGACSLPRPRGFRNPMSEHNVIPWVRTPGLLQVGGAAHLGIRLCTDTVDTWRLV